MNKFSKTFYPKQTQLNRVFQNEIKTKRQKLINKQSALNYNLDKNKQSLKNQLKLKQKFLLDQKIQIDSDLLFGKKENIKKQMQTQRAEDFEETPNVKITKNIRNRSVSHKLQERDEHVKTQQKYYEQQNNQNNDSHKRIRPKSRQQNFTSFAPGQKMSVQKQFIRPQTSKGVRKQIGVRNICYLQSEAPSIDIIINQKKVLQNFRIEQNLSRPSDIKTKKNSKKHNFKTSIDEQFLSLFAS